MQDKLQSAYNRLWLEASASCKTVELFFWAIHVPAIPHRRPSAWHREARTSVTWSLTHGTPFKLASEMKSDWCSLQHKYTEWKHWHRFYPKKNTIWKPLAHGLVVNFDRQSGPTFGCDVSVWTEPDNWVKVQWKTGLDNTVSTTPDVVTGSHQLPRLDTMVATFIVYHWWLSNPCSWISKILGSQIPGWCCVQVSFQGSRAVISQIWQVQYFYSTFATVLTELDSLSLTPIPQSWQQIVFVASIYLSIHFYIISQKYMLNIINNLHGNIFIFFIFFIILCFYFEQSGTLVMWLSPDQVMWPSWVLFPGRAFFLL